MINWPAFIKYAEDDELAYIAGEEQWLQDTALHDFDYTPDDCLIDSDGQVFSLQFFSEGKVMPQATGDVKSLEFVLGLIKAHAAEKGSCCVAKLYAPSYAEALVILQSFAD